MFDIIAFDADDTLWHNETIFSLTQDKLKGLLSKYRDTGDLERDLYEVESRNLRYFGYGIKSFTLSMIETAIELTDGRISGREIEQILNFGKEMLETPTQLLPGVAETISALTEHYPLMIITKGDLIDQETKIAQSGLADHFTHIEIVSEKTPAVYQTLLTKYGLEPERFIMIGNSLRSDILPVLEIGGQAIHIPYQITWAHEDVTEADNQRTYLEAAEISEVPGLIGSL
ncbi:MAG: HAD family hydrolase [Anaerolineae bacterium]|nr:HAD family hydrolase [Anaerolineae bacterium]